MHNFEQPWTSSSFRNSKGKFFWDTRKRGGKKPWGQREILVLVSGNTLAYKHWQLCRIDLMLFRSIPENCFCIMGRCNTGRWECHESKDCEKMEKCKGKQCVCQAESRCEIDDSGSQFSELHWVYQMSLVSRIVIVSVIVLVFVIFSCASSHDTLLHSHVNPSGLSLWVFLFG